MSEHQKPKVKRVLIYIEAILHRMFLYSLCETQLRHVVLSGRHL